MTKQVWEMSIKELDQEIAIAEAILREGGYSKIVADHIAMLQSEREERLIEQEIIEGSTFAKTVLDMHKPPDPD